MLKYKAKYLVENEDICYITIDKVEEVIKDTSCLLYTSDAADDVITV